MDSTDRLQVRDLIEKLSRFDPRARITGSEFEILNVRKDDNCLVYIDTDNPDEVVELENELEDAEEENERLANENEELKERQEPKPRGEISPTLIFDTGYASRLPSGDIEVQQQHTKFHHPCIVDGQKVVIPKADAEKLARFILEGGE